MDPIEAILALNAMDRNALPEAASSEADEIILSVLKNAGPELQAVAHAWERVRSRCKAPVFTDTFTTRDGRVYLTTASPVSD